MHSSKIPQPGRDKTNLLNLRAASNARYQGYQDLSHSSWSSKFWGGCTEAQVSSKHYEDTTCGIVCHHTWALQNFLEILMCTKHQVPKHGSIRNKCSSSRASAWASSSRPHTSRTRNGSMVGHLQYICVIKICNKCRAVQAKLSWPIAAQ